MTTVEQTLPAACARAYEPVRLIASGGSRAARLFLDWGEKGAPATADLRAAIDELERLGPGARSVLADISAELEPVPARSPHR